VYFYLLAIYYRNSGALLPAMLQGEEAEVGEASDVVSRREDAEDPAFIMRAIEIRVEMKRV
jgi:hypothetical protein